MENYYEQQVFDTASNSKAQAKYFMVGGMGLALFCVAIVTLVSAVTEQLWFLLAVTAVLGGLGIYLFIKKDEAYVEYEYVYAMGDLEIAKIINNNKRKTLCKVVCSDIEVFGKTTATNYNRYSSMPDAKKVFAVIDKRVRDEMYFFVCVGTKGKMIVHFEPDEEMLSYIKKHLRVGVEY